MMVGYLTAGIGAMSTLSQVHWLIVTVDEGFYWSLPIFTKV